MSESACRHCGQCGPHACDGQLKAMRQERDEWRTKALDAGNHPAVVAVRQERDDARARLAAIRALVDEQAEDAGLWFAATTAPEAYLMQELRRLHAAIEGE